MVLPLDALSPLVDHPEIPTPGFHRFIPCGAGSAKFAYFLAIYEECNRAIGVRRKNPKVNQEIFNDPT